MNRRLSLLLVPLVAAYVLFPRAAPRPDSQPHSPATGSASVEVEAEGRTGAPQGVTPVPSGAATPLGTPASTSDGSDRTLAGGAPHPSSKLGDWSCSDPPNCGEPTAKPPQKPIIPSSGGVSGTATWYAYIPGGAAAGPELRAFLGSHWRGSIVRVCAGPGNCVVAMLSDWCLCTGSAHRLIDLDDQLFAALAPLSQGLVGVTVEAIR